MLCNAIRTAIRWIFLLIFLPPALLLGGFVVFFLVKGDCFEAFQEVKDYTRFVLKDFL